MKILGNFQRAITFERMVRFCSSRYRWKTLDLQTRNKFYPGGYRPTHPGYVGKTENGVKFSNDHISGFCRPIIKFQYFFRIYGPTPFQRYPTFIDRTSGSPYRKLTVYIVALKNEYQGNHVLICATWRTAVLHDIILVQFCTTSG